jgi:o-succinylbenzoate synthase
MNAGIPIDPIYVHRYVLRSGAALNSVSVRREFHGALIKVGDGHGCIHPWPEFGDEPIDEQLELLSCGTTTPLTDIALRCAQIDGEARRKAVSLFDRLPIPQSHYSWSFGQDTTPQIERVIEEKWPAIKAKGFANWGETLRFLDCVARASESSGLKLRVDFNGCLEPHDFEKFCELMPVRVYRQLDLVEDPVPYDAGLWRHFRERWGVKLALDKGWKSGTDGFDAVIVKPSRRDWRTVAGRFQNSPLVLTSAMDHAFGQMFAAYEAAQANAVMPGRISYCGLATQHLFEHDAFFEQVSSPSGFLKLDQAGTGLGFDDALAHLPWKRLT